MVSICRSKGRVLSGRRCASSSWRASDSCSLCSASLRSSARRSSLAAAFSDARVRACWRPSTCSLRDSMDPLRLLELCPERLASRRVGRRLRRGCRRLGAGQLLYVVRLLLVQFLRRLGHRSFEVSLELYPLGRNRLLHEVTLLLLQVLNLLRPLAEAHLHLHLFLRKVLALLHDFLDDRVLLLEQHGVIPRSSRTAASTGPAPSTAWPASRSAAASLSRSSLSASSISAAAVAFDAALSSCASRASRVSRAAASSLSSAATREDGESDSVGGGALGSGSGGTGAGGGGASGAASSVSFDNLLDNILVRYPSLLRDDLPLGDRRLRVNPTLRVVPRVGSWGRRRGRRDGWFLFLALPARFRHGHRGLLGTLGIPERRSRRRPSAPRPRLPSSSPGPRLPRILGTTTTPPRRRRWLPPRRRPQPPSRPRWFPSPCTLAPPSAPSP